MAAELERRGIPFVRQTVTEGGMQVGQLVRLREGKGRVQGSSSGWSSCRVAHGSCPTWALEILLNRSILFNFPHPQFQFFLDPDNSMIEAS